jgi:rhodanese-related sulfurtransferase
MKTITPFKLQMLIDQGDVELIDVRPRKDFEKVHALVARSIPLSEFEPHSVLAHRKLDRGAPLYIMSHERSLSSLAACSLAGTGLTEPIVVEGGIEEWEDQCLPVERGKSRRIPLMNGWSWAVLAALSAGLGLVFHEFLFLAAFFVFAAWATPRRHRRPDQVNDGPAHGGAPRRAIPAQ